MSGARTTCRKTVHGTHTSAGVHVRSQALRTETSSFDDDENYYSALLDNTDESVDVPRLSSSNKKNNTKSTWRPWKQITVATHNVCGLTNLQACKKDCIAQWLIAQKDPAIYLMQETWEKDNKSIEVEGCLFISNGNETTTRKRGGVGAALSPAAVKAWKKAGQPEPIRPPPVAEATRTMAIELHFEDSKRKL